MYISRELKHSNIAEYLLYMWQVEDLLRANALDLDRIKATVVDRYELTPEQREEFTQWYADLIEMMRLEGVGQSGHLQINRNVLIDLTDLHLRLLRDTRFPYYSAAYYKVLPYIVELRAKGDNRVGELETCMDALYGRWMMQLQQKPIAEETAEALKSIATFMGMLSEYYNQDRAGTLFAQQEV